MCCFHHFGIGLGWLTKLFPDKLENISNLPTVGSEFYVPLCSWWSNTCTNLLCESHPELADSLSSHLAGHCQFDGNRGKRKEVWHSLPFQSDDSDARDLGKCSFPRHSSYVSWEVSTPPRVPADWDSASALSKGLEMKGRIQVSLLPQSPSPSGQ